jgi:hypothetical protein
LQVALASWGILSAFLNPASVGRDESNAANGGQSDPYALVFEIFLFAILQNP